MKNTLYYKELSENHNLKRIKFKDFVETCDSLELAVVEIDTTDFPDKKLIPVNYCSMKEYQEKAMYGLIDEIVDVEGIKIGTFEFSATKNTGVYLNNGDITHIKLHFEVSGQCVLIHKREIQANK